VKEQQHNGEYTENTGKSADSRRLHDLFRDMVDIYSPSGKEEEIVQYLAEYLEGSDLSVVLRSVDETRYNLEISAKRAVPEILLLGHVDTVPAYDIEQYDFSEEDGICRGLGTADMKGGCAALVEAVMTAAEGGFMPDNVLLSLVVGEEETGDGTEALLEAYRFTDALVAEPTGLQPCTSHYGYMELILTLSGYRRHAAMSDKSSNAIRAMLRLLLQLEDKIDAYERDTVLNIRDLHSSESGFAVPDSCSAAADLHLPADVDVKRYAEDLRRFLTSILDDSQVNDFSIEMPFIANGYSIDSGDLLVRSLASVYADSALPWKPGAFKSHSDANLLRDAGCAPVILGPGMLSAAHTRDEHAPYSQVLQAAEIYIKLLRTLSAS